MLNKAGFVLSCITAMVGTLLIAAALIINEVMFGTGAAAGMMRSTAMFDFTGLYILAGIMLGLGVIFAIIFFAAYAKRSNSNS